MKVGILAVQGDFEAHAKTLGRMGIRSIYVTHPKHLSGTKGLILPGGESTTMLKFLAEDNFLEAIHAYAMEDRGLFGTCAGAILLAKKVLNPSQLSLNLIDATLERNAYGRQLSSHIGIGDYFDHKNNLEMVFIRAPRITHMGKNVLVFAQYQNMPVGIIENRIMLTTFHPELTQDTTVHKLFIDKCLS